MAVTCPSCRAPLGTGVRFCSQCGANIDGNTPRPQTGAQAVPPGGSLLAEAQAELLAHLKQSTAGEYEILEKLGEGGMASVFLAHELALDRRVAIKVMSPALVYSGDEMVERFKREARTAASLSHPNIIPIYAVRLGERLLYFVMKFIEGESLEAVLRRDGPFAVATVQDIIARIGVALGYAHKRGVVHRDVKPANIMLDHDGWPVVTDFGIAKAADAGRFTSTGTTIGTPAYMSPEQCMGREITGASDQYALGVVCYELLTGRVPFAGDTNMAIMLAHLNEEIPSIRSLRPDCPPWVEAAVLRMLAKAPADRWPTLEDAVTAACGGAGVRTPTPAAAHPPFVAPARPTPPVSTPMQAPTRPSPVPGTLVRQPTPISTRLSAYRDRPPASGGIAVPAVVGAGKGSTTPIPGLAAAPAARPEAAVDGAGAAAPSSRRLTLSIAGGTVAVGEVLPLQLLAVDPDAVGVWEKVAGAAWTSSDPHVATVSAEGAVQALRVGAARIEASSDAGSAAIELTVSRVGVKAMRPAIASVTVGLGEDIPVGVHLRDPFGASLDGRVVRWMSRQPAVARVSPDGRVCGMSLGKAELVATSGGATASVMVRVTPVSVAAVRLTPTTAQMAVGEELRLVAEAVSERGRPVSNVTMSWASSDPAVANVTAGGLLIARRPGTVKVAATAGGRRALSAVTVVRV